MIFLGKKQYFQHKTQSYSVLINYWISRLFLKEPVRLGNRTIGVNLVSFVGMSLQMLKKHPIKNPLRGLGLGGPIFLQKYHPYGIQEVFEVIKVSASYPVRLGNRTYRTWVLGRLFFLKLTLMVWFPNRTYRAWW